MGKSGKRRPVHLIRVSLIAILGFAFFVHFTLWAQGSGSITGVIRDETQSAIPSVAMKITNVQTGVLSEAVSNEAGAYRLNSVPPGTYHIEAALPGFSTVTREVTLSTGQTVAVD